jgi:hypothetical protein
MQCAKTPFLFLGALRAYGLIFWVAAFQTGHRSRTFEVSSIRGLSEKNVETFYRFRPALSRFPYHNNFRF